MFRSAIIAIGLAGIVTISAAFSLSAEEISAQRVYAYAPGGKSAGVFMVIVNPTDTDDRLVDVRSDAAPKVELHETVVADNGVAKMMHAEQGFPVPAGGQLKLARGGKHIMLMGLSAPLTQGQELIVTLVFETAGEIEITAIVDNEFQPDQGGSPQMDTGAAHDHGDMGQDNG